ncbi:MAG: polymer-forming cytoskeletal protein [Gemmatimonadaceae bacterium]
MRRHLTVLAAISVLVAPAGAQGAPGRAVRAGSEARDSLRAWVRALANDPSGVRIVSLDSVRRGSLTVGRSERLARDVVVYQGDLRVEGVIEGNAVALAGNVIVVEGAYVAGDALAVGGTVRLDGGAVGGEIRSMSRPAAPGARQAGLLSPRAATERALSLAAAWFAVLAGLGVVVLLLARSNLEGIADAIRVGFARAFFTGIAAQLGLLPGLLLLVVGLAITVIGVLLIPFAIVAYLVAAAGALALGFVAMTFVGGEAMHRYLGASRLTSPSGLAMLMLGLSLFLVLWLLAAGLTWAGPIGMALRGVAAVVTWVAATVGFGATIVSRGGTRDLYPALATAAPVEDEFAWQTPTPVAGVVAARRPTPAPRAREPR